ncbi:beta-1,3-galactosyltransferase 1-like isoform X2 [Varroa destructor]|uniref:Hexosyltransferase n=1 Tax=Varroa destructor TaxID=109461 RepID=A0A7M7KTR6_VARDE|nr:beta-1,3-galactosyltransferase 1-like isoform X2 [Varroa destructor]
MPAIWRRLLTVLFVLFTLLCMIQMLTDIFTLKAPFGVRHLSSLNQVHSNIDRLPCGIRKARSGSIDAVGYRESFAAQAPQLPSVRQNQTSIIRKDVNDTLSPREALKIQKSKPFQLVTRPPRQLLKPGKKLQQSTHQLSNGTNVGWLPKYDREKFPLLHASRTCTKNDIYVAVVVTAGENFERRQVIRKTWGSELKTVFVLGSNATKNPSLEKEAAKYKDIVQAGFREGYYNLTYNTITALRWISIYCPQAEYIIKGDDDTWFNVQPLKTEIAIIGYDAGPLFMGKVLNFRTNRDRKSKWFTPREVIQQDILPKFLSGSGYVFTRETVPLVYNALLMEPLILNLEDLFITGFIAEQLGIPRVRLRDFNSHRLPHKPVNPCSYGFVLQSHELTPSEMVTLWKEMRKSDRSCP